MQRTRGKQPAIPTNWQRYLNESQMMTYRTTSNFGWDLYFIRRILVDEPIVVMCNHLTKEIGVIEDSGDFNRNPDIQLRAVA